MKQLRHDSDLYMIVMPGILDAMREFRKCMLIEDETNRSIYDLVNSFLAPYQGNMIGHTGEQQCNMLNPTTENTYERSVSGYLSFHYNPSELYFGLFPVDYLRGKPFSMQERVRVTKMLKARTETIHTIIQHPENFQTMAQSTGEKLRMGLAAKTVDPDPTMTAKMEYYPFDSVGLGTSDGKSLDLYVVKEDLNLFNARQRFPEPVGREEYWNEKGSLSMFDQGKMCHYRVNAPVPVMRAHVEDHIRNTGIPDKDRRKVLDMMFPEKKRERHAPGNVAWADVWFNDEMLLSIDTKDYHPIMVNKVAPPYRVMHFARGQGEKALPLLNALTHSMEKTVKAFERTYDPSWTVHDESEKLGLNLTADGITWVEDMNQAPKPNSLNADLQAPIQYSQWLQLLTDRLFYLDVFELINKSRMTKQEVQKRDSDDYRKMTLFIVQDQADDLNPLVLNINYLIHERMKREGLKDDLATQSLRALYTNEMAAANKNSIFNKMIRQTQIVGAMGETMMNDNPMLDVTDLANYYSEGMMDAGETTILRTAEDREARERIRLTRQKIADQRETLGALTEGQSALGNVQGAGGGGQGGGAG